MVITEFCGRNLEMKKLRQTTSDMGQPITDDNPPIGVRTAGRRKHLFSGTPVGQPADERYFSRYSAKRRGPRLPVTKLSRLRTAAARARKKSLVGRVLHCSLVRRQSLLGRGRAATGRMNHEIRGHRPTRCDNPT